MTSQPIEDAMLAVRATVGAWTGMNMHSSGERAVVLAVLTALREPCHTMTDGVVEPGDDRSDVSDHYTAVVDATIREIRRSA